jgi:hypothetical protein
MQKVLAENRFAGYTLRMTDQLLRHQLALMLRVNRTARCEKQTKQTNAHPRTNRQKN